MPFRFRRAWSSLKKKVGFGLRLIAGRQLTKKQFRLFPASHQEYELVSGKGSYKRYRRSKRIGLGSEKVRGGLSIRSYSIFGPEHERFYSSDGRLVQDRIYWKDGRMKFIRYPRGKLVGKVIFEREKD